MSSVDTAIEPLPRDGDMPRSWRNYFESGRRRNGEVISGINTLNTQVQVIQGQLTDIDGSLSTYYGISVDGGGNGAFLRLSDGAAVGSAVSLSANEITLDADAINFGAQTEFDTATETFITEVGSTRIRYGSPFGASSNVLRWYGPTSVAQGSETPANGYYTEDTSGVSRFNGAPLNWGATAAEAAASNALVPTGVNVCADTAFRFGTQFWNAYTTVGAITFSAALADGLRYGQVSITSWVPAGNYAYLAGFPQRTMRVTPGQRVDCRALVGGTAGLRIEIWVAWINDAGTWFDTHAAQFQTCSLAGGGAPSTYHEIGGFLTAPAGSAWGVLYFQITGGSAGTIQARVAAPLLARARDGQTTATPLQLINDYALGADPTIATLPANVSVSQAATFNPVYPLSSSSSSSISVAATTITLPGRTITTGSATITGLTASEIYSVFYDVTNSTFVAIATGSSSYFASLTQYVAFGFQGTQDGGGGYATPPPPPPGGGGGWNGSGAEP